MMGVIVHGKGIPETKEHREKSPRSNQKLKIMYLMKVLLHETDEEHSITLQELVEKLAEYNVTAERKSLYSDRIQLAGPEDVVEKMKAHVKKQCEMYGV